MKKKLRLMLCLMAGVILSSITYASFQSVSESQWNNFTDSYLFGASCDETVEKEIYAGHYGIYLDNFINSGKKSLYIHKYKVLTRGNYLLYNNSIYSPKGENSFVIFNRGVLEGLGWKVAPGKTIRHMTTAEEVSGATFAENAWIMDNPYKASDGKVFTDANYRSDGTHPNTPTKFPNWDAEFRTITLYDTDDDLSTVENNKALIECQKNVIRRCGDGILDAKYGETCDPKAEPWINNNECDPVTCKGPVCNSSYNGQTVSSLVPGNYLCNIGTMTAFQETSTGWTWKCDNVAGTDANCSAKKANNGRLDVEKTLVSETKYVTEVGQELIWEIKVTAKGGNVENVKIKDYLPEVLSYKDKSTVPTLPQGVTMKSTEPTKGADATGSYLQWDTEGTLAAGKSIVLRITTKVKTMPKTTDEYENVACARTEGLDEKCDKKPIAKEGEPIIKKTLIGNKTVENIGDILKWKIEITASGGDVSGFVLQDKVPVALEYVNIEVKGNEDNLSIGNPTGPVLSGKYNIYTWNVKGVLKSEHKLILEMTTKVKSMPTSEDDYKNVACVIKNGKENCDDDKPGNPDLRIKKEIINKEGNLVFYEGDTITYRIRFGNSGNADATITSIKDFLPKNVQYKSGSIHINRSSTHGDGTQVGDMDLIEGFKVVDGVRIEIYGGMTLKPGDEGEIIITGTILGDYTNNRTNFACIYLNDKLVDCDNASHDLSTPPPPSCFIAGTKVTMADGSQKNIEDVKIGEKVLGSNGSINTVLGYDRPVLGNRRLWSINESEHFVSDEHPFMTTEGWKSFNPEMTKLEVDLSTTKLKVGDILITNKGLEKIKFIDYIDADYNTPLYNFVLDGDNTYYANGYLVHNKGTSPRCESLKKENGELVCTATRRAYFRIACDGNLRNVEGDDEKRGSLPIDYADYSDCERVDCYVSDSKSSGKEGDKCPTRHNESEETEQCFNVNAGNFSIHEGEIFPFYWNLFNMKNRVKSNLDKNSYVTIEGGKYDKAPDIYEHVDKYKDKTCTEGNIAKDSMVCTFTIYHGGDNEEELYTIEGPCLANEDAMKNNNLLKSRYEAMKTEYCNKNSNKCYFSYNSTRDLARSDLLPSAVYYIENFGSNAKLTLAGEGDRDLVYDKTKEAHKPYGEYKIRLENIKYLKCVGNNWKQTDASSDANFKSCESNFVLTNPYTVQKTPSGNLTASTDALSNYKYLTGGKVFSSLINSIKTTAYEPNNNVETAMDKFIDKYSKLAVEVRLGNDSFLEGTKIKKVPGKNIYFVNGALKVKGGQAIKTSFTIVQTDATKTVTIVGNVQHNMMLLTKGNIIFQGNNCTGDQTVKGIFYAKGDLNRLKQYRNNATSNVWCTGGGLHIKGVLIGNKFDNLMNNSRSHLNDWFNENDKKKSVMNGASVLIEYSPSIFSKSTMPPGAEDFTTALSIYKQ